MSKLSRKKGLLLIANRLTTFSLTAGSFTTIPLTAIYDPLGLFSNNIYNIPYTGEYTIYSKLRLDDNTPITSYGQGVHTFNTDGSWFAWRDTNVGSIGKRNGLENFRAMQLNSSDPIRLYAYSEISVTVSIAEINIVAL